MSILDFHQNNSKQNLTNKKIFDSLNKKYCFQSRIFLIHHSLESRTAGQGCGALCEVFQKTVTIASNSARVDDG